MATGSASLSTRTPFDCNCALNTNHLNIPSEIVSGKVVAAFNALHHQAQEAGLSLHLPLYFTYQEANGKKVTGYSVEILRSNKLTDVEKIFTQSKAAHNDAEADTIHLSFERSEYTTMLHLTFPQRKEA